MVAISVLVSLLSCFAMATAPIVVKFRVENGHHFVELDTEKGTLTRGAVPHDPDRHDQVESLELSRRQLQVIVALAKRDGFFDSKNGSLINSEAEGNQCETNRLEIVLERGTHTVSWFDCSREVEGLDSVAKFINEIIESHTSGKPPIPVPQGSNELPN